MKDHAAKEALLEACEKEYSEEFEGRYQSGRKYEYTKLETWRYFLEACKGPEGSASVSLTVGKADGAAVAEVAMSDPVWRSLDRLQREQIGHAVAYGIVLMRESAVNPKRILPK